MADTWHNRGFVGASLVTHFGKHDLRVRGWQQGFTMGRDRIVTGIGRMVFGAGSLLAGMVVAFGIVGCQGGAWPNGLLGSSSEPEVRLAAQGGESGTIDRGGAAPDPSGKSQDSTSKEADAKDAAWQLDAVRRKNPLIQSAYYYLLGQLMMREHRWTEGEEAFAEVAGADPASVEARLIVAHLAVQRGDLTRAALFAEQVVGLEPDHVRAHLLLGGIYAASRRFGDAAGHYQKVLKLESGHLQARLMLAQLYGVEGDIEKTRQVVAPLFKHGEYAWRANMALGRAYVNQRQLETAADLFRKAKKRAPRQLEPVLALGAVLQELGRPREAEQVYREYLNADPENQAVHGRLGKLLLDQNRVDGALKEFQTIARLTPDSVQARLTSALILMSQSRFEDALKELRFAEAMQPENTGIRYYLGQTLESLSRFKEAVEQYQRIEKSDSFHLEAQLRLAYMDAEQERVPEAVLRIRQAVTWYPDRVDLLLAFNYLLLQNKEYQEVVDTATKGLSLDPSQGRFWFNRAMALDKLGRWSEAESDLRVYLTKQPEDPQALNYLGYTWADRGERLEEALELIRKAAKLQPGDGFITDSLGWVLFRLHRLEEAESRMREAVRLEPNDPTIHEHLGDVLEAAGKREDAVKVWRRALELDANSKTLPEKIKKHAQ